jgi:quercetin dioxygenase-like cupin family protein
MPAVIPIEDLRHTPTAALFEGGDDLGISIVVTGYERGQGVSLHVHPYPEVFVVQTGTATFTIGDDELTVDGGSIVVAPGQTPHGFKSAGDDKLRVVSVHPNGRVEQTDLERGLCRVGTFRPVTRRVPRSRCPSTLGAAMSRKSAGNAVLGTR